MRILKSTTCLTPIALLLTPGSLAAQLTISTATTTPVRTSTANSGAPADINITSNGSITLNAGSAVTVDSNNSVSNAGTITQGSANNVVGIDVLAGTSGTITNSGTIAITENFNAPNTDGNAIVDGPIAQATNRTGIWVRGAHNGNVVQTGTVNIEGLDSAGIRVDGDLTGSLLTGGTTKVRGDRAVGIKTQGVSGNVVIGGAVAVVGAGSKAVDIGGDIGGMLKIANSVGQSATFVDDNGVTMTLRRADLENGAPAVSVAGNVGGGILVAAAPTTSASNPDNDGDGVADTLETSGSINSVGDSTALLIGNASRNTTISALSGDTHGIVIAGAVNATAVNSRDATIGMQIGGLGGNVTVAGGIKVTGAVQATTIDESATAILISTGSSVPVLDNSGSIKATISSPGGAQAYGVRDLSGTLTTVNNSGFISAPGTAQDVSAALDLSANTSGVTINQTAPAGTAAGTSTSSPALTSITGNILTGSGNDLLNIQAGVVASNLFLGDGNDTLALSNDSIYAGTADFGNGTATLTLAKTARFGGTAAFHDQLATITIADTALFRGGVTGGSNLTVNVNGGTLEAGGTSDVAFKTLNVGANGTIKIDIDAVNHTNTKFVVDTANFTAGSKVAAGINSLANAEGTYTVLTANQLNGMPDLSADQTLLPYLFKGSLSLGTGGNEILLDIERKTTTELGLSRAQASAFDAILAAAPADQQVADSLLGAGDQATLLGELNQLLPDHAGGNFDLLTRGSRLATRHLTDNYSMFDISKLGGWIEPLKWTGSKDNGDTAGFKTSGFGISGGLERQTGIGHVGLLFNWMSGSNKSRANANSKIDANAYELGAFWRMSSGPFYAFARGTIGFATFKSFRGYVGVDATGATFQRPTSANWKGRLYSGSAGVSYQADLTERVSLRPMVIFDYYRLHEKGYTETGSALTDGSDAVDLVVAPRTSKEATARTTLTGSYRFGSRTKEGIPLTIEVEGGRRNVLSSDLGNTTAHFINGSNFTIAPEKIDSNWLGEVRLLSGGLDYTWQLAGGAEQTQGKPSYNLRFSLSVAF